MNQQHAHILSSFISQSTGNIAKIHCDIPGIFTVTTSLRSDPVVAIVERLGYAELCHILPCNDITIVVFD